LTEEAKKRIKELEGKIVRLDGKALTEKQREELIKKEIDSSKKSDEDFDPRQHRLKHGIVNYDRNAGNITSFEGKKGIKLT